MSQSNDISLAAFLQAARLLARGLVVGSSEILEQLAQMPQAPSAPSAATLPELETGVIVEVTGVQLRPVRPGEPYRVELTCIQRGPMPANPVTVWVTLPPGTPNPYQAGQQYSVFLRAV